MANDIPYLEFITARPAPVEAMPIAESPVDEAEIEAFKASVLAKLALMVGKDADAATERDWFVATALALRDRVLHRWLAVNRASRAEGRKHVYYRSNS
jgi:glycogen phosphorylase